MSMMHQIPSLRSSLLTRTLRFGNYIGEAESDEEQQEQVPQAFNFDEAFDDEEEGGEINEQQLMEVDGRFYACFPKPL